MDNLFALHVTYCRHNFGSVLQAFAIKEFLEKLGVKLILVREDYSQIERIAFSISRRADFFKKSIMYPEIKTERDAQVKANSKSIKGISSGSDKAIDAFIAENINVADLSYKKMKKYADADNCQFCIAGSDQIWNGSRVYLNPIYFLSFAPRRKRIALAPSFGGDTIRNYNIKSYKDYISKFEKLSARERTGVKLISDLCGKDAKWILDPVLLLTSEEWAKLEKSNTLQVPDEYIFAFFLNEPNEKAAAYLKNCSAAGKPVFTLGYESNLAELGIPIHVADGGPGDFLYLIRNAAQICTDSFHATVFSMIFHKSFYTFERRYINSDQSTRLTDFLTEAGLINRYESPSFEYGGLNAGEFDRFDRIVETNREDVAQYLSL